MNWRNLLARALVLAAIAAFSGLGLVGPAAAQTEQEGGGEELPWSSRCTSASRDAPATCQIEQRAVITETGQLLLLVTIAVPGDSRQPILNIRTPLQLFLPAGVNIDIDERNAQKLNYQTCDQQGCYARMDISNALLDAMIKGGKLNIIIENLNRQKLTVPMSLTGFTEVYGRVR
ncbi:invasion associated locus B family protein [Amorphus orientalis]|uniref:Invasion protein IalB n=1 Tax=Amorphus orientalis TaxID=649198 RepID=A0AAE3VSB3_9HYPH|nr:invasion associated locus B family protein [Amorphus orientalis]MDQ0317273.1 invasion protein IalB [Amorphus orientalis]